MTTRHRGSGQRGLQRCDPTTGRIAFASRGSTVHRLATASRVAIVGLTATLAGCGQLGPLYLPSPATEVITRPATDASTTATPTDTPTTQTPTETRTP